jgi:diadenosine tetraphosphate (Ap4A) HIT family hydrolase
VEWPAEFYAMRDGAGCPLCSKSGTEDTGFGLRFLEGRVSSAYLQRAAIQPGYTVVVWSGRHVAEPTDLTVAEAAAYGADVIDAARAVEAHFRPVKTNYQTLGNSVPHLHTHIIPRYADDPRPGWPFPFPDADPERIPEDRFLADVTALRSLATEGTADA